MEIKKPTGNDNGFAFHGLQLLFPAPLENFVDRGSEDMCLHAVKWTAADERHSPEPSKKLQLGEVIAAEQNCSCNLYIPQSHFLLRDIWLTKPCVYHMFGLTHLQQ